MCFYSGVSAYGQMRIKPEQWTRPVWTEYQEVLQRLAALDAKLGQPDCADPVKNEWMSDIEARLHRLEV